MRGKRRPCDGEHHTFRELPPKLRPASLRGISLAPGQKVYRCLCGTVRIQGTQSEPVKVEAQ